MVISNKKFAVIGTGVVGTALTILLEEAGWECIGVNTRSRASYERFRGYLLREHLELTELALQSDVIFITTLDDSIEKVAEQLSRCPARKAGQTWVHCSGSVRSSIMCKDSSLDINYLSIHPLQAFANVESALKQIKGIHFGIEGNNEASEKIGFELVKILGGIPHKIDPDKKTLYHAGAVVVSNYLVSLAFLGVRLFEQAGIGKEDALESLLPLMEGSYQNIAGVGLPCALTGPIARGDVEVVAKHLKEMPGELQETYKALGRLALEIGEQRKKIKGDSYDSKVLDTFKKILA